MRVIIQTVSQRIHGNVYVRPDKRLRDELNDVSQFIAVTEANVYDAQGEFLYKTDFIAISRDQIIWVIPDKEQKELEDES
ncbi:MAG: hypothetical protein MAG431_00718 [Chloroflexi bacterium]|nr:hypothetical protein [Chloroflexota bacterium]